MTLHEHIIVDTESSPYVDTFYPELGYALWIDNEEGNLDENGEPHQYYLQINVLKHLSDSESSHIWAKLIDDTMEVFGKIPGMEEISTFDLRGTNSSHTYIDENGVERMKRGVY